MSKGFLRKGSVTEFWRIGIRGKFKPYPFNRTVLSDLVEDEEIVGLKSNFN